MSGAEAHRYRPNGPDRPVAVVSVDVDPIDIHLAGYGEAAPPSDLVYRVALPRLLELFARFDVHATFFIVARDAPSIEATLRELMAAGHEVASHTMTHGMPFARLPSTALDDEIRRSREVLAAASGTDVIGFRAPNWDMSPRVMTALVRSGYRYDASVVPSPFQVPARLLLAWKSRSLRPLTAMHPMPASLRRLPFVTADGLTEFPVSIARRSRLPLYHTARYVLAPGQFARGVGEAADRGEPFFYPLHAVDALGLVEDDVDRRLSRHPGMERALTDKLDLLEDSLEAIRQRFATRTYEQLIGLVATTQRTPRP